MEALQCSRKENSCRPARRESISDRSNGISLVTSKPTPAGWLAAPMCSTVTVASLIFSLHWATYATCLTAAGLKSSLDWLSPIHNIYPDAYIDPPEFIRLRHFIPEVHYVKTRDNYILSLVRIVNPLVPAALRSQLRPVLLQHGLFTSPFNFIISSDINSDRPRFNPEDLGRTEPLDFYNHPPVLSFRWILDFLNDWTLARIGLTHHSSRKTSKLSESLAFELANRAYDVWMISSRGSTYSLNHTIYDYRHDWRYWDFSFHEIGLYDVPATIDYILELRGRNSLSFVGHSQGNLAMFVLQSLQPEWANKVKPFIALAPIAFIPDVYFGAIKLLVRTLAPIITPTSLNTILKGQVAPKSRFTEGALDLICLPKWSTGVCDLMLALFGGGNLRYTNQSITAVVAHHIPEGTSVLNVLHFAQMIESSQFRAFDFEPKENMRRYRAPKSPLYPIERIISRDIAFVGARTDTLATMSNVAITRSMLKVPLLDDYVVPEFIWGHSDFMYANGAALLANVHIIGLIDRYRLVP